MKASTKEEELRLHKQSYFNKEINSMNNSVDILISLRLQIIQKILS